MSPFLGRGGCDRDLRRRGRDFFRGSEVPPYQHNYKRNDEHQQNPYDDPQYFMAVRFRTVGRKLMVAVDVRLLAGVNGQSESPFWPRIARPYMPQRRSQSELFCRVFGMEISKPAAVWRDAIGSFNKMQSNGRQF